MTPEEKQEFEQLKRDLKDLTDEIYRNNFSAFQEFNKECSFTAGIQIPHYETLPSTAKVGQLAENGGKLYICSSPNTWTITGTQS